MHRSADVEKTRPSRPIGAPGGLSKVCATNRPTDTTDFRDALAHPKTQLFISEEQIKRANLSKEHSTIFEIKKNMGSHIVGQGHFEICPVRHHGRRDEPMEGRNE